MAGKRSKCCLIFTFGPRSALAEVLTVVGSMRPDLGQSGRWPNVQTQAATSRLPAVRWDGVPMAGY